MNGWLAGRASVAATGIAVVVVVIGGVAGIRVLSGGADSDRTERTAVASAGNAPTIDGEDGNLAGSSIALFDGQADSPDLTRTVDTDLAAAWAVRECSKQPAPETTRLDFIGGTESGPEYQRSVQVSIYRDGASASAAADALGAAIDSCAALAGADVLPASLAIGDRTDLRSVVPVDSPDSESAAGSIYAITLAGRAVVLTGDSAVPVNGSLPPVDNASPTADELRHVLTELCRLGVEQCAG